LGKAYTYLRMKKSLVAVRIVCFGAERVPRPYRRGPKGRGLHRYAHLGKHCHKILGYNAAV